MEPENIRLLLDECRGEYAGLLQEADQLLRKIDFIDPEEVKTLLAERQHKIDRLIDANSSLSTIGFLKTSERELLKQFAEFQEECLKKILSIDGLVVALAKEKRASIMVSRSSFIKGKIVRNAFGSNTLSSQRTHLDRTM